MIAVRLVGTGTLCEPFIVAKCYVPLQPELAEQGACAIRMY